MKQIDKIIKTKSYIKKQNIIWKWIVQHFGGAEPTDFRKQTFLNMLVDFVEWLNSEVPDNG